MPPVPEAAAGKIVITFDESPGSGHAAAAPATTMQPTVATPQAWSPVVLPPQANPIDTAPEQTSNFALRPQWVPAEPLAWVLPGLVALAALLVVVLAFTGTPMLNPLLVFTHGSDQRGSMTLAIAGYLAATAYALLRDRPVGRYLLRVGAALALPIAAMSVLASIFSIPFSASQYFYEFEPFGRAASYQPVPLVLLALVIIGALVLDSLLPMTGEERPEAAPTAAVWVARFLGIVSTYMGVLTLESVVYERIEYHYSGYSKVGFQTPYADIVISLGLGIALLAMSPALRRGSSAARTGVLWVTGALGIFIFLGTGTFSGFELIHSTRLLFGLWLNGPMLGIAIGCICLFVLLLRQASRPLFHRGGSAGAHRTEYVPTPAWATAGVATSGTLPQATVPTSGTNGMAIGAFICGLLGVSAVAIVLGFIARNQIAKSGGREGGAGMALAGIILGFVWVAISILILVSLLVLAHSVNSQYPGGG